MTDGTYNSAILSTGELKVAVTQALPTGSNTIGAVTQASGPWTSNITQVGGSSLALGAAAAAASIPVTIASNQAAFPIELQDGSGNAITSGAQGSARALDIELFIDGAVASASNPIPVTMSAGTPGTEVHNYNVHTVAAGSSFDHDYSITSGKTFKGEKFWASSSEKIKIEVQISPDGTNFTTKWVGFNSVSCPNIDIMLNQFTVTNTGAGSKIRIIKSNLDKSTGDIYSTISGVEI